MITIILFPLAITETYMCGSLNTLYASIILCHSYNVFQRQKRDRSVSKNVIQMNNYPHQLPTPTCHTLKYH